MYVDDRSSASVSLGRRFITVLIDSIVHPTRGAHLAAPAAASPAGKRRRDEAPERKKTAPGHTHTTPYDGTVQRSFRSLSLSLSALRIARPKSEPERERERESGGSERERERKKSDAVRKLAARVEGETWLGGRHHGNPTGTRKTQYDSGTSS